MAVKIYGIPFSTCTKRVTMLLEELQVMLLAHILPRCLGYGWL